MTNTTTKPQVILTWVSGSWKTTLLNNLLTNYPNQFWKPLQYTTRKQRNDRELDDYIFLSQELFIKKLINWDFIEYICYNKQLYAVGTYFNMDSSNIFIAEPVGREALIKYFRLNNIPFLDFYLEIDDETMLHRLWMERRESQLVINERLEDFNYFEPRKDSIILDWTSPTSRLAEIIKKEVDKLERHLVKL